MKPMNNHLRTGNKPLANCSRSTKPYFWKSAIYNDTAPTSATSFGDEDTTQLAGKLVCNCDSFETALTKTSQETQRSLQKFLEPDRKPKVIYTDNSLEFGKACEDLSWNHCTSTPHRSETNGIAERAVRSVKEGTSAVLLQSGLNESWWADSMECYTYLRNVTDLQSDGKTPYERRFGQPFKGPIVPFGSLPVKNPSNWRESLTWIVPRIRIVRGENLEG